MKLNARDALRFLERPDTSKAGVLIYGADAMRVALKRQDLVARLVGPEGEAEMRLTRIDAGSLRGDPAELNDALKAQGFFAGPRVVLVESATDAAAAAVSASMEDWQSGDAMLVVTAGALKASSKLRKLFEATGSTVAIAVYNDPPSRDEIEGILAKARIAAVDPQAMRDLESLARELDPGDFRQTVEKLALYTLHNSGPVSPQDIADCAPATTDAAVDAAVAMVADGDVGALGAQMSRLAGQSINPTTLCITAGRHFRQLHAAATADGGAESALARMRPPVFGPRRDQMLRQLRRWAVPDLETALGALTDTDLALRSSRPLPGMALVERAFIRIAMLAARRR